MTRSFAALLVFVLTAAPAFAGESDSEQRFHDAYVKEVIEGEVAPAAKVYLSLMRDEDAPVRLRAEARFRFAVCAVLLGRPDEARIELSALIVGDETPKSLRTRAEAYLKRISAIGVGSELDKKLQELVFDLARVEPGLNVETYREFEVIGKASLPFVRKLLTHDDVKLRRHAYRILARMGEPGLGARWKSEIGFHGSGMSWDLQRYFDKRSEELQALEKTLTALDDNTLYFRLREFNPSPRFSLAFVSELIGRERVRDQGFAYLSRVGSVRWPSLADWLQSSDAHLQDRTARWVIGAWARAPAEMQSSMFPHVVRSAARTGLASQHRNSLFKWAQSRPVDQLLGLLEELVAMSETWPEDRSPLAAPVANGIADMLARPLDEQLEKTADFDTYVALLRRWLALEPAFKERAKKHGHQVAMLGSSMRAHLGQALERASWSTAEGLCEWLFEGPMRGHAQSLAASLTQARTARGIYLIRVGLEKAPVGARKNLTSLFHATPQQPESAEVAKALVESMPKMLHTVGLRGISTPLRRYTSYALAVSDEDRRKHFERLVRVPAQPGVSEKNYHLLSSVLGSPSQRREELRTRTRFLSSAVVPVYDALWSELSEAARHDVIYQCATYHRLTQNDEEMSADRDLLAAFVRRHFDAVTNWDSLIHDSEAFPHELWIPLTPYAQVLRHMFGSETADRAAKAMTSDLATVNSSVLAYIKRNCSDAVRTAQFDRVVTEAPMRVRKLAIRRLDTATGAPASVAAIQACLYAELKKPKPDAELVASTAELVLKLRPSESLFAAARVLLQSEDRARILDGIQIAASLGRPEMLADLVSLLDSMDSAVRTRAKAVMDGIRDLVKMRREGANWNPPRDK